MILTPIGQLINQIMFYWHLFSIEMLHILYN